MEEFKQIIRVSYRDDGLEIWAKITKEWLLRCDALRIAFERLAWTFFGIAIMQLILVSIWYPAWRNAFIVSVTILVGVGAFATSRWYAGQLNGFDRCQLFTHDFFDEMDDDDDDDGRV